MAVAIIPAIVAAEAGTAAAITATIAGALIDSLLLPALLAKNPRDGARIGDLQIADNAEGAPLWRFYGEKVRAPGLITWSDQPREVADRTKGGGKGGSGASFLTFRALSSARIEFAHHAIGGIEKVYADSKLFWSERPPVNFFSTQLTASVESSQLFGGQVTNSIVLSYNAISAGAPTTLHNLESGADVELFGYDTSASTMFIPVPPGARTRQTGGKNQLGQAELQVEGVLDTTVIAANTTIRILGHRTKYRVTSGVTQVGTTLLLIPIEPVLQASIPNYSDAFPTFGNVEFRTGSASNDGNWEVVSTSYDPVTQISTAKMQSRDLPGYPFAAQAAGINVLVLQKTINSTAKYGRISVQLGDENQSADPLIVARLTASVGSASQVIADKGSAGVFIEDIDLTDFGNRLANFEAILSPTPDGDTSVARAIVQISELAGIPESRVDVSQVTGTLRGMGVRGVQDPGATIQLLMLAFDIVPREVGDRIIFCDRELLPVVNVALEDLGVGQPGNTGGKFPFEIQQVDDQELPSEVVVTFIDPARGYQTGSESVVFDRSIASNILEIRTGIVMTRDEARALAARSLALAHGSNFRYSGTIAYHYLSTLQEGMIMRVPSTMGRPHDILITQWDVGVNGIISWEGRGEDPEALIQNESAGTQIEQPVISESIKNSSPSIAWHALDIAPLRDTDRRQPGYYLAAASADPQRNSSGFVLMTSTDGVSFSKTAAITQSSIMGWATSAPSSSGIVPEWIDRATVVRVELLDPSQELESVTEVEMIMGANRFMWGNEMIGAASCTFVSAGVYDLSVLKRGIGDTADELLGHSVGDRIVWLNGGGVQFIPINHAAIGGTRRLKVVGAGGIPDLASSFDVTIQGRSVMPHRPAQVFGVRDASNNLTVTWKRVSRAIIAELDQGAPLDDDMDQFLIQALDSGVVVREEVGLTSESWVYSAANQTSDGLTPGDPVDLRIKQKSIAFHTGRTLEITV